MLHAGVVRWVNLAQLLGRLFGNLGGSGFKTSGLGPCKVLQKFGPPFFYHPGHNGCPGSGGCPRCRNPRRCRRPSRSRSPLRLHRLCIGTSSKLSPLKAGPALCHRPWWPATPGWIAGWVGAPVSRCGKLFHICSLSTGSKFIALGWQGYFWKAWQNVRSLVVQDLAGQGIFGTLTVTSSQFCI